MKSPKPLTIIFSILIITTLAFIWGNSLESIPESQSKSLAVLEMVKPFLEVFVGEDNATDHLVRKIAHFIEFGVLGCELALLIILRRREKWQPIANGLFFGLAAAVADESLQLLSARGSQVQDVLLDYCGFICGMAVTLAVATLVRSVKRKQSRGEEADDFEPVNPSCFKS